MKIFAAALVASALAAGPVMAQQMAPNQNLQNEADKGIKTHNSGASGNVGSQETPGAAAHPPGQPGVGGAASATSSQNSGAGISGAPGSKSGPTAGQGTVGSAGNSTVQQDPANVKGLPGNKNGPPAKR
jgi:hypothetical protein